jgi:hypothetical protein
LFHLPRAIALLREAQAVRTTLLIHSTRTTVMAEMVGPRMLLFLMFVALTVALLREAQAVTIILIIQAIQIMVMEEEAVIFIVLVFLAKLLEERVDQVIGVISTETTVMAEMVATYFLAAVLMEETEATTTAIRVVGNHVVMAEMVGLWLLVRVLLTEETDSAAMQVTDFAVVMAVTESCL